ncbi:hypothetical protein EJ05DRAFT_496085 [Pseudovirgaria hyperparasitica]|uniref:Tat pathway signal sequence n=1 Tax=Pseudovirgaria hyperparasitica TaxID=470096 RepID=A0A6A6WM30_9PEZI|nr:uncharacterized protein EJ05DRAFT_496085 [Pseudovirgaria hyperparasitica]KAF2763255.1 hypothetical protein EJ05DRAFT_496085 [Pseudovirgaria hyperparasitica]
MFRRQAAGSRGHDGLEYVRLENLDSSSITTTGIHRAPDAEEQPIVGQYEPMRRPRIIVLKRIVFVLSLVLNFVSAWKWLFPGSLYDRILTYSPALPVIENERVVFSSAFGIERSPFQGEPSEANNELWTGLYDFGITRISAEEARPMDNKTLPLPDNKGGYVVQLSVFHQLHCLNMIRKGIYNGVDMSNVDELMGIEHIDHCIDMLRQSIMCHSDITPTTFARQSLKDSMKVVAEVVHTCRKFSNIQQWAWNRRIKSAIDKETVVTNDPLGWGTYTYSP